jgi:MFS family permease
VAPLSPTVRRLGLVSLLTDASSEMIYPLLPAFVTGVLHAGPAFLGLVEGIAEAVASLLKIVSGALSDRAARRKGLVFGGYFVSSLARPLMALAVAPIHVLAIRFADRVGKGVRSAPRDALIAEATASTAPRTTAAPWSARCSRASRWRAACRSGSCSASPSCPAS